MYIKEPSFPDFNYPITDIVKYHQAAGLFTMLLKSGEVIHYQPELADTFEEWLLEHNVQNIRNNQV